MSYCNQVLKFLNALKPLVRLSDPCSECQYCRGQWYSLVPVEVQVLGGEDL